MPKKLPANRVTPSPARVFFSSEIAFPKYSPRKYLFSKHIAPKDATRALLLATVLFAVAPGQLRPDPGPGAHAGSRLSSDFYGMIAARQGEHIRLDTVLGNVVIRTRNTGRIDYRVHLETQPNSSEFLKSFRLSARETPKGIVLEGHSDSPASRGLLWVTIELNIPRECSLHVSTGGGNIEAEDVNGRVALSTAGGNITTGDIGESARLSTDGGHITVKNVGGDLIAETGGGQITAGDIGGSASLSTRGGHISVSSIQGSAHLETGGGNVTLERSGNDLFAETTGGQVEIGEAAGLVRAKTGGGAIRVVRSAGPETLQTLGGSIYLTEVSNSVRASTAAGNITAWFVAPSKLPGVSELQSSDGDIVVYLPGNLPVTVDAQIDMGREYRVVADPAFPLNMSYDDSGSGHTLRGQGSLNGGGEVLRLHAAEGNIRLIVSDSGKRLRLYRQQMDQLQEQLQSLLRNLDDTGWTSAQQGSR